MQNQYNNYLKRQKQQPINNFKEKVTNSLSGKRINNTTTPNTSNPVANKLRANMNVATQGSTSHSKSVQPINNINTQQIVTTPPNTQQTPQNTIVNETVPSTNLNGEVTNITPAVEGGQGLMSLSDINNSISAPVNEVVSPKARTVEATNARSASTTNANNYKDLLEQNRLDQIAQADKNWQIQEEAFKQQMDVLNGQYEQSKADAENAYNDSVNKLNENRYNQMEDLNVSGTNRGIQYSPQQLGLENVVNINHNKNLVETSKQRNELLNKLQIEMNNSLAQLNMTMVNARNEYNKNILDINTNYSNTLMNWNREDALTQDSHDWEQKLLEEKRKWEEAQAQKDREFQQMMQDLQNKFDKEQQNNQNNWQSGENALDREHDKTLANMSKSRSGGGYSGYSRGGYSSYSRSYNPYSRGYYNGWNSYDGGEVSAQALEDEITQQAIDNKFKQLSTDVYNSVDTGGVYDLMERAGIYSDSVAPMYDIYYGLNKTVDERLNNTRETALKHLVNKSVARSTNGAYNIGDTVYQHKSPLRKEYIDKVKKTQERTKNEVYQKFSKNPKTKFDSKNRANAESIHEKIMSNKNSKTSSKKSNSSKSNDVNKKLGAKNSASIKKQQTKQKEKNAKKQEKAKAQQKKRVEINKKFGAKNQAYIKKQMEDKKKQQEKAKKFKDKVKKAVKKIFKKN